MGTDLYQLIHDGVTEGKKPAKQVAADIGKPYSTLMRELAPWDEGAKLGIETLIPLMRSTGDTRPLQYLAAHMGFRLVSLDDVRPNRATLAEECLETYPALVAYHGAMEKGRPLAEVGELRESAIREIEEDFVAYRESGRGQ